MILLDQADYVIIHKNAVLEHAAVLVEGDRIAAVGSPERLRRRAAGATRIDCRGCIVLPGLINAHNHLYQVLLRGLGKRYTLFEWTRNLTYPITKGLQAEDHYHAVLLGCLDSFRNGTTAIVDMPTHFARFHSDAAMRALRDAGVRGALARAASDASTVDPGENRDPAEELETLSAFLDRWQGPGLVQPWLGPSGLHSTSAQLLREMKELAVRRGVRFHIHLGESQVGRDRAIAAGYAGEVSWAHALNLLEATTSVAHGVWVNPDEVELLRQTGSQVVHNPSSNQVLASGVAPIAAMRAAGVPLALGSDGPASNDALDMFAEMKSAALLQRVHTLDPLALTAADVFEICTEGGARVLGMPELGRLEPGFLADVVAVQAEGNPGLTPIYDPVESLVYHGSGRDVALTMVAGRVVYQEGRFPTVDAQQIFREVRRIRDRIASAHPGVLTRTAAGQ